VLGGEKSRYLQTHKGGKVEEASMKRGENTTNLHYLNSGEKKRMGPEFSGRGGRQKGRSPFQNHGLSQDWGEITDIS